jgi:hypothetical protein
VCLLVAMEVGLGATLVAVPAGVVVDQEERCYDYH